MKVQGFLSARLRYFGFVLVFFALCCAVTGALAEDPPPGGSVRQVAHICFCLWIE